MKKFMSLFLALVMLLAMAACGTASEAPVSEEPTQITESESPASEAPVSSAPAEEAPAEDEPEADATYSGAASAADSLIAYPIADAGVTLSFWTPFVSNMPDLYSEITDIPCVEKISENTGVNIEWTLVSGMDMFSQFNLMAASGDYCDLIEAAVECYSGGAIAALNDGVLIDLTPYIEDNCPDYLAAFRARGVTKDILTGDGRYACLYGCYDKGTVPEGLVVRQDWLDGTGSEVPQTFDQFFDVLSAFKSEYGCSDAYLYGSGCSDMSKGFDVSGYTVSGMNSSGSDLFQRDGVMASSFYEENYRQYLREMKKWYDAGIFSVDFITRSSMPNDPGRTEMIANGQTGMWQVNASTMSVHADACGATLKGIGYPVMNEGDITHFSNASYVNSQCDVSVSTACENIEAALRYLNYYFTNDGVMMYNYGVEGETYNLVDGKVVYTDLILNPTGNYTSFTMTEAYVLVGGIASLTYSDRQLDFADETVVEAWETWNSTQDTAYYLPKGISLTTEESERSRVLIPDIATYAAESVPKFIIGDLDIEKDWDGFVATVKDLGLDEVLSIYQAALDRYNA